jgi:hypothetical protein
MTAVKKALQAWGIKNQRRKLAEEAAELAVAALHADRETKEDLEALFEEIADVEIMIEGMRLHYGDTKIDGYRASKLARLERRVDEALAAAARQQERAAAAAAAPAPRAVPRARHGKEKAVLLDGQVVDSCRKAAIRLGVNRETLSYHLRKSAKLGKPIEFMGVMVAFAS